MNSQRHCPWDCISMSAQFCGDPLWQELRVASFLLHGWIRFCFSAFTVRRNRNLTPFSVLLLSSLALDLDLRLLNAFFWETVYWQVSGFIYLSHSVTNKQKHTDMFWNSVRSSTCQITLSNEKCSCLCKTFVHDNKCHIWVKTNKFSTYKDTEQEQIFFSLVSTVLTTDDWIFLKCYKSSFGKEMSPY